MGRRAYFPSSMGLCLGGRSFYMIFTHPLFHPSTAMCFSPTSSSFLPVYSCCSVPQFQLVQGVPVPLLLPKDLGCQAGGRLRRTSHLGPGRHRSDESRRFRVIRGASSWELEPGAWSTRLGWRLRRTNLHADLVTRRTGW